MNYRKIICNPVLSASSILIFLILIIYSCEKLELNRITKIQTGSITDTKQTSCTAQATVIEIGEVRITQHGHCWSTKVNPSTSDSKTQLGSRNSTGSFISALTGLTANTTYYIRAYAIGSNETTYSNELSFTTLPIAPPSITTSSISNITANSAITGGNITNDGGSTVTAKGVCWSTSQNPTITGNHTTDGNGPGSFTSSLTGLSFNTIYYVKAYATNNSGTAYGNEISFTTLPAFIPSLTTDFVSNITANSATCGGNVTDDGGAPVTARGVCWSISQNPTVNGSHTNDDIGTGSFSSHLTGLNGNITYYIRAYATNVVGTAYGGQVSFITETGVTDIDGNTYNTIQIGSQLWMKENLKTTHYADETSLVDGSGVDVWEDYTTKYWFVCGNDLVYKDTYGLLYTWAAVMNGAIGSSSNPSGVQGVCPAGWHVPSDTEWTQLIDYLGGESVAGGKMKETGTIHWLTPNTEATNESGFSGLAGGMRTSSGGFSGTGSYYGYWWSSTESSSSRASARSLYYSSTNIPSSSSSKNMGFSVRCLRD
jgi:uncharacterized protein (TIGR02145 family)